MVATLWDSPNRMGGSMGQDWWRYLNQDTLPNQYPGPGIITPAQDQGRTVSYAGTGPTKMDTGGMSIGQGPQFTDQTNWWQSPASQAQTPQQAAAAAGARSVQAQTPQQTPPSVLYTGPPPAQAPQQAAAAQARDWALPGWAWGGNQLGGGTYNAQTGQWAAGAPLAAGSDVYGAKLPVAYNSANDRGGLEYNGKNVETFWSRMLRWAQDYRQGNKALTPEQAMQMAIDRLRRDNGGTLQGTGFADGGQAPQQGVPSGGPTPTVGPGNNAGGMPTGPTGSGKVNGQTGGNPVAGPATPQTVPMLNNPAAIANAAQDQRAAYDMYNLATYGTTNSGHGPFSQFYDSWFGPIVSAAINAMSLNPGAAGTDMGLPTDLSGLFSKIQQGMAGQGDVFGYLGGLAKGAMQRGMAGGAGQDFGSLANLTRLLAPLTTMGLNPIGRDVFYNKENDALRALAARGYNQTDLGGHLTDWGQYFQNSPFAQTYYGGGGGGSGVPQLPGSAGGGGGGGAMYP